MPVQRPHAEPSKPSGPSWAYLALVVLIAAIGNNWSPDDVRSLGYALLAIIAVGACASRDR